ncbi:hypothetical protein BGZ61DRAFT_587332 [Ilyonectria robusta]|uniref:uncharacterized protein n=1 Tax=Ilyonectria robusta TaxID=1079257 RepID=UPI001E8D1DF1|nr:uncharacterized protein BGZ61DRAFT_587332 [Ilyonectria robusta]KAH8714630.1 hypothetical protein BGZ61DRAFT_587332 [Ilyonectria robusta]
MDPVTAIGLASSILTFIDVGVKVLQKANEIRNSQDSSTKENRSRRTISDELEFAAARMKPLDDIRVSPEQESLCKVARECQVLSKKMLKILESIKPRKSHFISTLIVAAKVMRKQDDLEALDKELRDCRGRLTLSLVELFRQESTKFFEQILSLVQKDAAKFDQLQTSIGLLREGVHTEVLDQKASAQFQRLMGLDEEALHKFREDRILHGLQFDTGGNRFDQVEQPHPDTFNWIFEEGGRLLDDSNKARPEVGEQRKLDMQRESREKFLGWLASPGAIFHIRGKLGSGKSTLMKFLSSHLRTRVEAKKWAGDKQLVIANFFFWRPGLDLQKSIKGLSRSLLHDLLEQRRDLIPEAMPDTWDGVSQTAWQTESNINISPDLIKEALGRVMRDKRLYEKHRFCYFIDGLDEHENTNHADYQDLVKFLGDFSDASEGNLKLCLSSREENVFMTAYSEHPSLQLHQLTQFDMRDFVLGRLQCLQNNELRLRLAKIIPEKAEGIFFWTSLVVRIIRDKHADGKSDEDLEHHLETLPLGLKELFVHILHRLDDESRRKTYEVVALLDTAKSSGEWDVDYPTRMVYLTLLAFSFLDEYHKDKEFSMRKNFLAFKKDGGRTKAKTLRQLRGACGGLIECHEHDDSKHDWGILGYAHRSVPEMFQEESAKLGMGKLLKGFNSMDALSHLIFAQVQFTSDSDERSRSICAGLVTKRLVRKVDKPPYHFLECMSSWIEDSGFEHPGPGRKICVLSALNVSISVGYTLPLNPGFQRRHFVYSTLCVAAFCGVEEYTEWKIRNDPTAVDSPFKHALVAHCMLIHPYRNPNRRFWEHSFESGFFTKDIPTNFGPIFFLNQPQSIDGDQLTVWQRYQASTFADPRRCSKAIEQFMECGVDTSSTFTIKTGDQGETRWELRSKDATIRASYEKEVFERMPLHTFQEMHQAGFHSRHSEGDQVYSFRDWVETMELKNKERVLDLIDRKGDEASQADGAALKSLEDKSEHSANQVGSEVQPCDDATENEDQYADGSHGSKGTELFRTVHVVTMILLGIAIGLVFSSAWMRLNGEGRDSVTD